MALRKLNKKIDTRGTDSSVARMQRMIDRIELVVPNSRASTVKLPYASDPAPVQKPLKTPDNWGSRTKFFNT